MERCERIKNLFCETMDSRQRLRQRILRSGLLYVPWKPVRKNKEAKNQCLPYRENHEHLPIFSNSLPGFRWSKRGNDACCPKNLPFYQHKGGLRMVESCLIENIYDFLQNQRNRYVMFCLAFLILLHRLQKQDWNPHRRKERYR